MKPDGPGVWDVMSKRFFEPATINTWAVVNYTAKANEHQIEAFAQNLQVACRALGRSASPILIGSMHLNYSEIVTGMSEFKSFVMSIPC